MTDQEFADFLQKVYDDTPEGVEFIAGFIVTAGGPCLFGQGAISADNRARMVELFTEYLFTNEKVPQESIN